MKRNRPELVLEGLIMLNWNMNHFLKFQLLKNSCFLALYTGFGCLLSDQIRWQLGWILKLPEAKCGGIWSQFWRLVTSLRTNDVAGSGGGDTRPRYPPKAMSDNYLTANLWGPVGQTAAWVLAAKFLPSSCLPGRDFVPGPVAVKGQDTNHWATKSNWNRREEKRGRTKVPASGYILKRKL